VCHTDCNFYVKGTWNAMILFCTLNKIAHGLYLWHMPPPAKCVWCKHLFQGSHFWKIYELFRTVKILSWAHSVYI
jgi:hypothetical protein